MVRYVPDANEEICRISLNYANPIQFNFTPLRYIMCRPDRQKVSAQICRV
ncbi:unnamed protein product [Blumeria hordei]|uniref:Uncharacterized protein n=1 Tax=Blumeria hordei TaxID=2867405 RepID=A0A383UIP7_BLUHO|nr:unnamed protein product [Blumeria hordei]